MDTRTSEHFVLVDSMWDATTICIESPLLPGEHLLSILRSKVSITEASTQFELISISGRLDANKPTN